MTQFANAAHCTFWWGLEVDIVNAECLMTNNMAMTEQCQNRARTTILIAGGQGDCYELKIIIYEVTSP